MKHHNVGKGRHMQFAIVNESKDAQISSGVVEQIAAAVERQLYEHYAPFWESSGAPVRVYPDLKSVPTQAALVALLDSADQAGVLGYHDVTPDGRSYARVFWKPIRGSGGTLTSGSNSLSVTVSHEVLETIGDPYASFWGQDPSTGLLHALELCDACEAESYVVDGISVSNFVGPRFFRSGAGPYDWMSQMEGQAHITRPFETLPGGYQIVATSMSDVRNVFGKEYPEWRRPGKEHAAARTAKRLAKSKEVVT